jgi:phosphatidylethanolamine/phosphatidyl-N-methylethanolamine N-methyltransferase
MEPNSPDRGTHRTKLERGQRIWDFWSSREWFWELVERDITSIRRDAVSHLGLDSGDVVLDIGCGAGTNFSLLREAVGHDGRVLGIDYSPQMVQKAKQRIDTENWENVDIVRADATRVALKQEQFDGAIATSAVGVMPDVRAVLTTVYETLQPDTRFALYDVRLVPSGPAQLLNPLISRAYRFFGNWNAEEDVLDELRTVFDDTTVVRRFALGTNYVVIANKAPTAET